MTTHTISDLEIYKKEEHLIAKYTYRSDLLSSLQWFYHNFWSMCFIDRIEQIRDNIKRIGYYLYFFVI